MVVLAAFLVFLLRHVAVFFWGIGSNEVLGYSVKRLNGGNPIVTQHMFAELGVPDEGENINGPSVIRVPDWLPREERTSPKANYYMYFARHGSDLVGDYIRLAWAERIEGPWTLFQIGADVPPGSRGVLDTGTNGTIEIFGGRDITGSVGSPDVIVDHANRRFVMYFHSQRMPKNQKPGDRRPARLYSTALVATSWNGLDFNRSENDSPPGHGIRPHSLGRSYFRTFEANGWLYAIANTGTMYRAPAPGILLDSEAIWAQAWERDDGPLRRTYKAAYAKQGMPPQLRFRHFAVLPAGDELHFFFSRKADIHERIQMAVVDISGNNNWKEWPVSYPPLEILNPEMEWEGANRPLKISKKGGATGVRQLRDPCILKDEDGSLYLFYTGAGEEAIGVVQLFSES